MALPFLSFELFSVLECCSFCSLFLVICVWKDSAECCIFLCHGTVVVVTEVAETQNNWDFLFDVLDSSTLAIVDGNVLFRGLT